MSPEFHDALENACTPRDNKAFRGVEKVRNSISKLALRYYLIAFLGEIEDYMSVREVLDELRDGLHTDQA